MTEPPGVGDKKVLRLVGSRHLGLTLTSEFVKRAIQVWVVVAVTGVLVCLITSAILVVGNVSYVLSVYAIYILSLFIVVYIIGGYLIRISCISHIHHIQYL